MFVDTVLREREAAGRPIRVGMIGAGATGRAIALQLSTPAPGIRLVAISNRTIQHGERAFREAGITDWRRVESARGAEISISHGTPVLTDDPSILTMCQGVDVIVEVTIDDQGNVTETRLLQSLQEDIDVKVIATLRNWRFKPATLDGTAISSRQDVHFHFPS